MGELRRAGEGRERAWRDWKILEKLGRAGERLGKLGISWESLGELGRSWEWRHTPTPTHSFPRAKESLGELGRAWQKHTHTPIRLAKPASALAKPGRSTHTHTHTHIHNTHRHVMQCSRLAKPAAALAKPGRSKHTTIPTTQIHNTQTYHAVLPAGGASLHFGEAKPLKTDPYRTSTSRTHTHTHIDTERYKTTHHNSQQIFLMKRASRSHSNQVSVFCSKTLCFYSKSDQERAHKRGQNGGHP